MKTKKRERRILLLPGFGEDRRIFENLCPFFGYRTLIHIDYRAVLKFFGRSDVDLDQLVEALILYYHIDSHDILIGHSTGGFFAHHIRQKIGAENCLIGAFTDTGKVQSRIRSMILAKILTLLGLFTSGFFRRFMRERYASRPSLPDVENILDTFSRYPRRNIWQLLRIILTPRNDGHLAPSLRIHGREDRIIAPPDEFYYAIPGDHFVLSTNPQKTAEYILDWLSSVESTTEKKELFI